MSPVPVLHIFGRMEPGGAEVRLIELMAQFDPAEFRVDVCALSGLNGSLDAAVRARGGSVFPIRLDARFPWRFARLLRRERYRVVHSHVHYASGPVLALAAATGVPVRIAHFHATHDGRTQTLAHRMRQHAMRRLTRRCSTDIIACGEGVMLATWGPRWRDDVRCQVVYDAIDVARFERPADRHRVRAELGIGAGDRLFIHVGNQLEAKNHARLVAIFAQIQRLAPSSWLVLAGAGVDDADGVTARTARQLGIADRVRALGVRGDVPRLLKAADTLLLPSLYEGLPGVVLEACASGIPVLASDLPGVQEIASRLSLVQPLPLTASDEEWARAALELPRKAEHMQLRETAAAAFRRTVFHVDRAADAHRVLWGARHAVTPLARMRRA